MEVGGVAVGLGSTSNISQFMKRLENIKLKYPLLISMDNDGPGQAAQKEFVTQLKKNGIPHKIVNLTTNDAKDPNEMLVKHRQTFIKLVTEAKNTQFEKDIYLAQSAANHLQDFIDGIAESANTSYIPTNFKCVDKLLDGGLYEGLYAVGAISSLGKTTFVTQIADQIADQGYDVLIISLEMARNEIIAKSISRNTAIEILRTGGDFKNAKTVRGITTGSKYQFYSNAELELIQSAIENYGQYASNIYIVEGIGNIGVKEVRKFVEKHKSFTGNTPVVIIDYLQILAPFNDHLTDKQNTDKSVTELKRISRDFKTPVIAISSFNRDNYNNSVSMQSFKESGAIEYSSDVLIGLQFKGVGESGFDANEAKLKSPREVELVVLKNRNGQTGIKMDFEYYAMFNYFEEKSVK